MYSSSSSINMSQERKFKKMILSETSNNNNDTMSISTEAYNKTFADMISTLGNQNSVMAGGSRVNNSILDSATSTNAMSTIARNNYVDSATSEDICE